MTTTTTTPHLFRCHTCLETYATDTRNPGKLGEPLRCSCGGQLRYLGQVNKGRVIYSDTAPPCNYMCGDAIGLTCNCQCGGANHGRHLMVAFSRDAGGAPTLQAHDPEACDLRAHELTAAREAVWARVADTYGQDARDSFRTGAWMSDRAAWDACREAEYTINAAMKLQSHGGRLARLARG